MAHYTLRQSTAGQEVHFPPILDSTDLSAETGLTIANTDIKLSKSGATAEASKNSGGATHKASGRYYAVLDATDTDTLGSGRIDIAITGTLPVFVTFEVLSPAVYDAKFGATAPNTATPLDAAGVRSAVGLAAANLDTQLTAIDDFLDTEVGAIKAKTDNLPSDPADASVIAGRFDTVDTSLSGLDTAIDGISAGSAGPTVSDRGEVVRGWPHAHRFVPAGAVSTVVLYGPDAQIPKTAPVAVAEVTGATGSETATGTYVVTITPDELGLFTLVVEDGDENVVHTATFLCVEATTRHLATATQPAYHGLITSYARLAMTASPDPDAAQAAAGTTGTSARIQSFISGGHNLIPVDGYVYGVIHAASTTTAFTNARSVKFFTADPANSRRVRGISEDLTGLTPVSGSWTSGLLKTVYFNKPVPCRQGDEWGFEVDDTDFGTTPVFYRVPSATNVTGVQTIKIKPGVLSLTGSNTFTTWGGGVTDQFQTKLLLRPPAGVIAGLSHWAGSPESGSIYANHSHSYVRAHDIAAMLSEAVGEPFIQCGWGGTNITQWVGASGYFTGIITPLKPSVVVYDSAYNDAGVGFGTSTTGFTEADYRDKLDELIALCHGINAELVLLEAFVPQYATDNPSTGGADFPKRIERLNAIAADWAQRNAVLYVPLYSVLGAYEGSASEHRSLRRTVKAAYQAVDDIHLTQAGRKAAAQVIAQALRGGRRYQEPRLLRTPSLLNYETPPVNQVSAFGF